MSIHVALKKCFRFLLMLSVVAFFFKQAPNASGVLKVEMPQNLKLALEM